MGRGSAERLARRRIVRDGFTLIELMIVVAIVGILAVVAFYAVRKYLSAAKTAEARNTLGRIAQDASSAFEKGSMSSGALAAGASTPTIRTLCGSASQTVPSDPTFIKAKKYQSSPADWNVDAVAGKGFACLQYMMDQPQYYMYDYKVTGSGAAEGDSFRAIANGDLNGDGTLSTFSLAGRIQGGFLNLAPHLEELATDE